MPAWLVFGLVIIALMFMGVTGGQLGEVLGQLLAFAIDLLSGGLRGASGAVG